LADRVVFLRPDAERIARAVRTVEAGNRNETPLTFRRVGGEGGGGSGIRICTFSGAWPVGGLKAVTFLGASRTVTSLNLFAPVPSPGSNGYCAIAKNGTVWYLIAAQCS
jgi:hypothetical protein